MAKRQRDKTRNTSERYFGHQDGELNALSFIGPECTALICIVLNQDINLICKCKCITTSIYPFMGTMQWKGYGISKYRVTYWINQSKKRTD